MHEESVRSDKLASCPFVSNELTLFFNGAVMNILVFFQRLKILPFFVIRVRQPHVHGALSAWEPPGPLFEIAKCEDDLNSFLDIPNLTYI